MAASYDVRYPKRAPRKQPLPGAAASEWLDVDQAASVLHVGVNTVRRRAAAGVLGSTTMGGRLVVSRADVENLAAGIAAGTEARDRRTRTNREGRLPNTWNSAGEVQIRPASQNYDPEPLERADVPSRRSQNYDPDLGGTSVPPEPAERAGATTGSGTNVPPDVGAENSEPGPPAQAGAPTASSENSEPGPDPTPAPWRPGSP